MNIVVKKIDIEQLTGLEKALMILTFVNYPI